MSLCLRILNGFLIELGTPLLFTFERMVLEVVFLPKMLSVAPVTSLAGKMELHEPLLLQWQMIRCLHILVSNQPPESCQKRFELNGAIKKW